jgi:hypothetical protein
MEKQLSNLSKTELMVDRIGDSVVGRKFSKWGQVAKELVITAKSPAIAKSVLGELTFTS